MSGMPTKPKGSSRPKVMTYPSTCASSKPSDATCVAKVATAKLRRSRCTQANRTRSVSYTHLTLPTIYSV